MLPLNHPYFLEREIAAEEREKARIAQEQNTKKQQHATAHQRAFSMARAGNSDSMIALIEEFNLDVTAPEFPRKQQKQKSHSQTQGDQYETILHVAAQFCDETIVLLLINRGMFFLFLSICHSAKLMYMFETGADTAALNKQHLTPFHASILSGNVRVVRWFLERHRSKPMEGCHPSKATSDPGRRTPLQLALASGVPDVVQALLNDATVHDVRKCWEHLEKQLESASAADGHISTWTEMKDVLWKKVGAVCFRSALDLILNESNRNL